jgi:hypothetical protein
MVRIRRLKFVFLATDEWANRAEDANIQNQPLTGAGSCWPKLSCFFKHGTSRPFSLRGVISIGVLYGFVYAGIRLAISHNLPQDDVTSNILAQTLEPAMC